MCVCRFEFNTTSEPVPRLALTQQVLLLARQTTMVDGHRPGRCCRCFWTTLVLGTMFGAAVFVTIDLRDAKPVNRPRGRPASALLDRKLLVASSRTVPRRLPERLNRTLQRSLFFSSRKARNPALPAAHANRPVRTSVVDASDGPLTTGPSTCRAPQSAVCERCVAASRGVPKAAGRALASSGPARASQTRPGQARGHRPGPPQRRCPTSYQWSWNKPLEANDAVRHPPTHPPPVICPLLRHLPTSTICPHLRCAGLVTHIFPVRRWLGRATACLGCVRCAASRRCTSRASRWWRSGGRATGLRSCAAAPWACAPSL